ncbi:MAG: hypothetical protein MJ002_05090 [Paludibacteraceae bacterium]|nr:hypothetical protein [Paludibacteraceae bacterium]
MAKVKPTSLLNGISGQVDSSENVSFRYRFGKQEAYHVTKKKRPKMTQNQKNAREDFSKIIKIASLINKNPQLNAPFLARYNSLPEDKRPQILYRSIIADLSADPNLLSQYEYLLS